ncbi:MAG: cyanophycinase [Candidatus Binatia bacterium]
MGSALKSRRKRSKGRYGQLIVIGGHEDKTGEKVILRQVAAKAKSGTLAVATVASRVADELWLEYQALFRRLGVKNIVHLAVASREEALVPEAIGPLKNVTTVFFTGGDQLKITSKLGGTPIHDRIQEIFDHGGTIAGTSAGASVLSENMLVSGPSDQSSKIGEDLSMAPGFGFAKETIFDQHFAERGRIGRLLGAVARNPRLLGVGIDEDTAILMHGDDPFRVFGSGGVYVLDGHAVNFTNISDEDSGRTLSVFGIKVHVLSDGDRFDVKGREPISKQAKG